MKSLDHDEAYAFFSKLSFCYNRSPVFREIFDMNYSVELLANHGNQYLANRVFDGESEGAKLSVLLKDNRLLVPLYKDLSSIPRRLGILNGTERQIKEDSFESDMTGLDCYFGFKGKIKIMLRKNGSSDGLINLVHTKKFGTAISDSLYELSESGWPSLLKSHNSKRLDIHDLDAKVAASERLSVLGRNADGSFDVDGFLDGISERHIK
ncbi:MAG: hypothetical protein Q8O89_07880 [Nanoarchaeota archaeon]|nr:hypothetical protein [Nanoarchaeota archaeon]